MLFKESVESHLPCFDLIRKKIESVETSSCNWEKSLPSWKNVSSCNRAWKVEKCKINAIRPKGENKLRTELPFQN